MKAFFVACGVLAVLTLTVVPSNALFGVDDDVVGYDILLPFFMVSIDNGGLDTVIAITETGKSAVTFHWMMYNKNSMHVADSTYPLVKNDVATLSVRDIINNYLTTGGRLSLEYDLDGDGTNDHYVGWIEFVNGNTDARKNQVKAMAYFINLPNNISAGMNLPVREVDESLLITDSKLIDQTRHTEYFSPNALFRAQQYIALQGKAGAVSDADYFRLLPRYYLNSSESSNYFFIWSSTACPTNHVTIYDTEANSVSANFPSLSAGLNIIDVANLLPPVFLQSFPVAGWVDISIPGIFGNPALDGDREMLGYSFQLKLNGTKPLVCGDTNGNGELDVGDAMYIAQFLAGNKESLSCVSPSIIFSLTEMQKEAGKFK